MNLDRVRWIARKPPRYLAWRLAQEARRRGDWLMLLTARFGRGPLVPERIVPGGLDTATAIVTGNPNCLRIRP